MEDPSGQTVILGQNEITMRWDQAIEEIARQLVDFCHPERICLFGPFVSGVPINGRRPGQSPARLPWECGRPNRLRPQHLLLGSIS